MKFFIIHRENYLGKKFRIRILKRVKCIFFSRKKFKKKKKEKEKKKLIFAEQIKIYLLGFLYRCGGFMLTYQSVRMSDCDLFILIREIR